MLAHLGHGGRLAHSPQPRPRRRPACNARLARLTVSASHSLLRSSALHSMAVTVINSRAKTQGGLFRHMLRRPSAEEERRERGRKFTEEMERNARGSG